MATLTFLGAARQVTGSCYLIETEQHKLLLECGLTQGSDKDPDKQGPAEESLFAFEPHAIDAVIISHAHLDHSGMIPFLIREGYKGPIYTTDVTQDLLPIMYYDAASLMASDIERKNRRLLRAGKKPVEPPYTLEHVKQSLEQLVGIAYQRKQQILDDIQLRFNDAGHILGSAIVELWITDNKQQRKLVFSGDLGNSEAPLLNDPAIIKDADVLLLESTYGDRNHRPHDDTLGEFHDIIESSRHTGGNILIPAFAVGRTQDLIYWLGQLYQDGKLKQRVYLDSPMAIKVSEVYEQHYRLFNNEDPAFKRYIEMGWENWLPTLTYTESPEESMALNRISDGAIIIAGSGMCNGGRILHHFKHNLWREKTQLVIVGYQAVGTLGRALVDGVKLIKIFGEEIAVKAKIHTLGAFSAHAGQSQLLAWAENLMQPDAPPPRLFLVHGDEEAMQILKQQFQQKYQWDASMPEAGDVITL